MSTAIRPFVVGEDRADISVIVVTYNSAAEIEDLIASLRGEGSGTRLRVVVADNSSSDETLAILGRHHDVSTIPTGGNLGYSGGINVATEHAGTGEPLLILNPDLRVEPGSIGRLLATLQASPEAGAVAPKILDDRGQITMSLFNEPTVLRALGDALLGPVWRSRPPALTEWVRSKARYDVRHSVDWTTGAALLVSAETAEAVGEWDERFFLYSEETDYCRRIRDGGQHVLYEPAAAVHHSQGKSGSSPALDALLNVNRVRYMRKHSPRRAAAYRWVAVLGAQLRVRRTPSGVVVARALRDEQSWTELPHGHWEGTGEPPLASFVIPAHNEQAVIGRTLSPLRAAAAQGSLDVHVVCNGCTDGTDAAARGFSGVRVTDIPAPSKVAAVTEGRRTALSPLTVVLDADIEFPTASLPALRRALSTEGVLAARPPFVYDVSGASWPVRAYYRARMRMPAMSRALWGAGVYGLNAAGSEAVGDLPPITADDYYVDSRISVTAKRILLSPPVRVRVPRTTTSLLGVLVRSRRGPAQLGADSGRSTLSELRTSIAGPLTLFDACVYVSLAARARLQVRRKTEPTTWERDESTR